MGATFSSVVEDGTRTTPGGKTLWPELVGKTVIDASQQILQDRRGVRIYFYDYGEDAPPPGFDPKRVVLFRTNNRVVTVPKLG